MGNGSLEEQLSNGINVVFKEHPDLLSAAVKHRAYESTTDKVSDIERLRYEKCLNAYLTILDKNKVVEE